MDIDSLLQRLFKENVVPDRVVTLKGDASSRKYHRLFLPNHIEPNRLIVMELPEDALKSDEVVSGEKPDELPFINVGRYLQKAGLRVPKVLLNAVDDGALLLEDLGDIQLVDVVAKKDENILREWYFAAVALLVKMHESMWPIPNPCIAAKRAFDYDLLRWELDHYREWGVEARQEKPLPKEKREQLDKAFDALAEEIDALPKGFVHRDYQSRNLMVLDSNPTKESFAIIDFQDAFVGPRIYDLVALLNDSYVTLSPQLKNEIINRYATLRKLDYETLLKEFHLVTIQRKLKDAGRFIFIDRVKDNPAYLGFVDTSLGRVKTSLIEIPEHESLKGILLSVDPNAFS